LGIAIQVYTFDSSILPLQRATRPAGRRGGGALQTTYRLASNAGPYASRTLARLAPQLQRPTLLRATTTDTTQRMGHGVPTEEDVVTECPCCLFRLPCALCV